MERSDLNPPQRGSTPEQAKQKASNAKNQMKDEVKTTASDLKEKAKTQTRETAEKAKMQASSRLTAYAEAARAASRALRENDETTAGDQGEAAADQIERFAHYLQNKDTGALLRDVKTFARRNPEWFLGGTLVAGLAMGRFLRASAPDEDDERYGSLYTSPNLPARVPEDVPSRTGSFGADSSPTPRSTGSTGSTDRSMNDMSAGSTGRTAGGRTDSSIGRSTSPGRSTSQGGRTDMDRSTGGTSTNRDESTDPLSGGKGERR